MIQFKLYDIVEKSIVQIGSIPHLMTYVGDYEYNYCEDTNTKSSFLDDDFRIIKTEENIKNLLFETQFEIVDKNYLVYLPKEILKEIR